MLPGVGSTKAAKVQIRAASESVVVPEEGSWNTARMRTLACIASLMLFACGEGDGAGTGDGGTGGDALLVDAVASDTADAMSKRCATHEVPREITFEYDGVTRSVLLAGPDALPSAPLPLVVNFHGYSDSPEQQEDFTGMSEDAVQRGFVVAYPRGTGIVKGWNAGACCGSAVANNVDDVGFAEALVDEIAAVSCIDTEKVFATGYSNGGFLSHRLACESSVFAGIAPVAGVVGVDPCTPERSIPVLHMHGTSDVTVPFNGNFALGFSSVADSTQGWVERLSCSDAEPSVFFEQGDASCVRWAGCDAPLGLCTIDGGGHTWPGGETPLIRGKTSTDLQANAVMLEFLDVL